MEYARLLFLLLAISVKGSLLSNLYLPPVEISSFIFAGKRIRIWGSPDNKPEIPYSQWKIRYDPIFTPEVDKEGKLVTRTTPYGKEWHIDFTIHLDSAAMKETALSKLKEIYGSSSNFDSDNVFAIPVKKIELSIPELFEQVSNAKFLHRDSCGKGQACVYFHRSKWFFRVIISCSEERSVTELQSLLPRSSMNFKLMFAEGFSTGVKPIQGQIDFDDYSRSDDLVIAEDLQSFLHTLPKRLKDLERRYEKEKNKSNVFKEQYNRTLEALVKSMSTIMEQIYNHNETFQMLSNNITDLETYRSSTTRDISQQTENFKILGKKISDFETSISSSMGQISEHNEILKKLSKNITDFETFISTSLGQISKNKNETFEVIGKNLTNLGMQVSSSQKQIFVEIERLQHTLRSLFQCPDGWSRFVTPSGRFKCLLFGQFKPMHFEHSRQFCLRRNATLIKIESYEESMFVLKQMTDSGITISFLGIVRKSSGSSTFVYEDTGEEISYTNWASDEPNNANGEEDCVEMHSKSGFLRWNDTNCKYFFIPGCEIVLIQ